ncbi:retrovirus-related pol polyprotein from transposon TNT 1-94 [Tanacetum coccineum]
MKAKKYTELSAIEKIQADCDMKATNIIIQGLPTNIYSLVNHHRVAKDLWERVQLLMQGTSLTKQERECKLLPPEWSKFVTDLKLVKDLHTTNFDQLHVYLQQHEIHANEVRLMREHNQDPFALVGRQSSFAASTSETRANISGTGGNNSGQQRVVKCFNCQGGSHMARQCPKPKRKRDATCVGIKVFLVDAHGIGCLGALILTVDDFSTAKEMPYSEQPYLVNYPENKITSDSNIISYSQYLLETQNAAVQDINSFVKQDAMILSVFEQLSNQVTNYNKVNKDNLIANESLSAELERYKERKKEAKNIDKEIALEKKVKELDNIICKIALGFQNPFYLKKAQQIRPMLYDGSVIAKETNVISIADSEETLMLEEESRSKMLLKQNFGKRFIPQQELSDEQAFQLQTLHHNTDQSASSPVKFEAPREF